MKKILLSLFVCLFIGLAVFANQAGDSCKILQAKMIDNMNKVANCTPNSGVGISEFYVMQGVEQGKCHYKKQKIETTPTFNLRTIADCHAPMSVVQSYANDNLRMAREFCSANGINENGYIAQQNEKVLEAYCKY